MANFLSNFPTLEELTPEAIQEAYKRASNILSDAYPDMDTTPGSVFGDTILRPMSYLIAGLESSLTCMLSDLDLRNLANGVICDCDFAREYLRNLGLEATSDLSTISTVRLTYTSDGMREFSNTVRFYFSPVLVRPLVPLDSEVVLLPSTASYDDARLNIYRLTPGEDDTYFVDLPVYGPIGANVDEGTSATTDLQDPTLQSVVMLRPLRPVSLEDTVQNLAGKAFRLFPASGLTTRSSAITFFESRLANVAGVSPVTVGDVEMQRGSENLFGVTRNAVDIYIRGNNTPLTATSVIRLGRGDAGQPWKGYLNTGGKVPIGIVSLRTLSGTEITDYTITGGTANDNLYPGLSAGFTKYEELGLTIPLSGLDSEITANNFRTAFPLSVTGTKGGDLTVSEGPSGNVFSKDFQRALRFVGTGPTTLTVENLVTGESVEDVELDEAGGTLTIPTFVDPVLERWLSGAEVEITPNSPGSLEGEEYYVNFEDNGGYALLTFHYDPAVNEAEALVLHPSQQGPYSIEVAPARPLYLLNLRIEYTTKRGKWVDTELARKEILQYINSSLYPDLLTDSTLSDILLYAGASGVSRIAKSGIVWSTLAERYVDDRRDPAFSGTPPLVCERDASVGQTTYVGNKSVNWADPGQTTTEALTIDDQEHNSYVGARNVQFILAPENLVLIERRLDT